MKVTNFSKLKQHFPTGEITHKYVIIAIWLTLTFSIGISALFWYQNFSVYKVSITDFDRGNSDIAFFVDGVKQQSGEKYITIEGWCIKRGEDIKMVDTWWALKEYETGELYQLKTRMQKREDVTESINDGFNYDNCGLATKFKKARLPQNKKFEICILYMNNGDKILVETNEYVDIN